MVTDSHPTVRVSPIPADGRTAGLELLFDRMPLEERQQQINVILSFIAANATAAEGLIGAFRAKRLVGAIFAQLQAGKTAQVWLPRLVAGEQTDTAVTLLNSASQWLEQNGVRMAQISLEVATDEEECILRKSGFDYLASLLYLVCHNNVFPLAALSSQLQFEPYNSQNHDRFAKIVEITYLESLDCQKLNTQMQIQDILDGYRATGEFSPTNWLIVRHDNRDVGCLILADHPQHNNLELVYMGIAPAFRGHGWGMDIARYAQLVAGRIGRARLVLGVDASNHPAINMYASVGFQAWDQRRVYFKIFPR